jgi:hypothetical protein
MKTWDILPTADGRVAQLQSKMVCERPPRSLRSRLPLTRGRLTLVNVRALFSPSARGRAAEGGRGSLTHHLELEGNTSYALINYGRTLETKLPCREAARARR